ncbi:MAG TPA: hypothetical protein DDW56_04510 [Cyanobacteria bacterium UBA11366]|nr:hypothetical protein [Cyanobacteria bacterium UBA11366]HCA94642.1 hypothetical protein [Cyanobacteria bacterium UBA9226]
MANTRIRLEADLEQYLRSQSMRVMEIPPEKLTAADLTTLTNRVIYEHKLGQSIIRQDFVPRLIQWFKSVTGNGVAVTSEPKAIAMNELKSLPEDFDLANQLANQFDEDY